jgi:hypothetical protein
LIEDINNHPPDNIENICQYKEVGLIPLMLKGEGNDAKGMYDLMYSGIRLAIGGKTTLEELFREVISPQEIVERKEYVRSILPRVCKELADERNIPGDTSLPKASKKIYKR